MMVDYIFMNPPYDKNLHLKILEQSIPMLTDDGILVNLSPIRWLQDPTVFIRDNGDYFRFEGTVSKYIKNIKWLSLFDMEEMFRNVDVDAAIYIITKNGGFDYERYAHNTIFDKVSKKGNFISSYIEKDKIDGIRVRINPSLAHNKSSTRKNSESVIKGQYEYLHYSLSLVYENGYSVVNGKFWSKNRMPGAGNKVMPEGTPIPQSLKFHTIKEAVNFENSTKTMFYRYLTLILKRANNPDYVPFMGDCTNPRTGLKGYEGEWTDEDFYGYFNITEDEQKEIVETMKPYWT